MKMADHGGKGFTIVEMLVVVAIVGILSSITLPTLGAWFNEFRLVQFSNALMTTFKTLRLEAISRERRTRAEINLDEDNIVFQVINPETAEWENLDTLDPVNTPGGVFINSLNNSTSGVCTITFTPVGGESAACAGVGEGNTALHFNHEGAGRDDDCRLRTIYFSSMLVPGGVLLPYGAYGVFEGTYAYPPNCHTGEGD